MGPLSTIPLRIVICSRWLMTIFYGGLIFSLLVMGAFFVKKLVKFTLGISDMSSSDVILTMLSMLDMSLIASLIVMVVVSGYDGFIQRIQPDTESDTLNDLTGVSSGTIKLKISTAIILISAIYILETLMDFQKFTTVEIGWALGIHVTLAITGLILAIIEKLSHH